MMYSPVPLANDTLLAVWEDVVSLAATPTAAPFTPSLGWPSHFQGCFWYLERQKRGARRCKRLHRSALGSARASAEHLADVHRIGPPIRVDNLQQRLLHAGQLGHRQPDGV